ncbi:transposase [Bifidobacterium thermophilum]|uniref:Transposase n=1 Tax=Bifidobacterium thermophilum TaxID=33905 RepID=A0A2N3QE68_9BIFI|nr:transposase [Bifidobacterium thermophilum]
MHINRLAKSIVGVERIKVRGIAIDGAGALVIDAEPYRARSRRCGRCGRETPRYDAGCGVRLWRCCDVGGMKAYVRSEAFRVSCPECGIVAREVLWAAHGSRFSYAFEDTCCWCALSMCISSSRRFVFSHVFFEASGMVVGGWCCGRGVLIGGRVLKKPSRFL